jgi:hypothetical protein
VSVELIRTMHKAEIIYTQSLRGECVICGWRHLTFHIKGNERDKSRATQLLIDVHDNRNVCAGRIVISE